MVALPKTEPLRMSLPDFLAWNPQDGRLWQLVDGEPQAMAPASRTHGAIQGELAGLLRNHLLERGAPCSVIITPGVIPRVNADENVRVPDLAVTCSPYDAEQAALTDPVLVIEILSPSNRAETWMNVWAYTSIPSVQEILVIHTDAMGASLLRRRPDASWPERPSGIEDAELVLESVGFRTPLAALYRTTRLAR